MQLNASHLRLFLSCAAVLLAPAFLDAEPAKQAPETRTEVLLSFAPIVKKVQPAVVNVYASRTDKRPRNPLFDDQSSAAFLAMGAISSALAGRPRNPLGSGVLVDASGLVITNYHVIENMTDVRSRSATNANSRRRSCSATSAPTSLC